MKRIFVSVSLLVLFLSLLLPGVGVEAVGTTAGCPVLSLKLSPKMGPSGTRVEFLGTVQIISSTVVLSWGNDELAQELWKGKATGYEFQGAFIVPKSAYGVHDIYVYTPGAGSPSLCPGDRYKILPTVTLASTSACPNTSVSLTANGFPANESIVLNFDGALIKTATANDQGGFSASLTIPRTISGSHILSAISPKLDPSDSQEISFVVSPIIRIDNPAPTVGAPVVISGDGYTAKSRMTFIYDDLPVIPKEKEVITDDSGSFKATVIIPNSVKPKHTITATDGAGGSAAIGNSGAVALNLEKEPPPQPMPITPINERFGIYGSQIVAFKWSDVKDPSGVTYTFEIGRDLKFFPPVLRKKDLEESQYVLADNQALSQGTYYWRVKAVDGAGNESSWVVAPQPFSVGLIPLWGFVVAGLVGLVIALLVLRAILRFIVQLFRFY